MRTPKSFKKADAKRNSIVNRNETQRVIGNITILAVQTLWGDGKTTRTISVFNTDANRCPWDESYEEDLENYEFDNAEDANAKFKEIIKSIRG